MYDCLIVDDEKELADATKEYFQMFGLTAEVAYTADECRTFMQENEVCLLLLDINLGQESGFTLCKELRENTNIPILFISARQSDDDVLIALNIGGDDYIKKPYSLSVLLAKVKVVLKRFQQEEKREVSEGIELLEDVMKVRVDEREISLKPKEWKLFAYLYHKAGKVVTKEELFQEVWGDGFFGDGTLNVHVRKLREKIEKDPNKPEHIKTVWGTGYIYEP